MHGVSAAQRLHRGAIVQILLANGTQQRLLFSLFGGHGSELRQSKLCKLRIGELTKTCLSHKAHAHIV